MNRNTIVRLPTMALRLYLHPSFGGIGLSGCGGFEGDMLIALVSQVSVPKFTKEPTIGTLSLRTAVPIGFLHMVVAYRKPYSYCFKPVALTTIFQAFI